MLTASSYGQTAISPAAPEATPSAVQAADTVRAIKLLYARRRQGSWLYRTKLPIAAAVGSVALFAIDTNPVGLILVGTAVGVRASQRVRFSSKREATLLREYQRGKALPAPIRKRLKKKHFK